MNRGIKLTLLVSAFVILLGGAYLLYNGLQDRVQTHQLATTPQETQAQLQQAPNFTVYDAQGNPVQLADFVGKPVVLNFWASWCGPCRSEMGDFNEKFLEMGDKVQFLMVNATDGSRETAEIASAFIADSGYAFPVFYDTAYQASSAYGVSSLPTTYFIDKEGNLVAQATGAISADLLQQGIDMIAQ